MKYYKGRLYTGIKGDYGIRKMKLCSDGTIQNEYIHPNNMVRVMQGIDIYNSYMYAFTDTAGYKIIESDIL